MRISEPQLDLRFLAIEDAELHGHLREAAGVEIAQELSSQALGARSPQISVVVPTHDRRMLLEQALNALEAQNLDPELFEVIVVDNASQDDTISVLEAFAQKPDLSFRAVTLAADRGPAVARNVGALLARGELIAFTDSDCLPSRGWLRECLHRMGSDIGVVQGRTEADPANERPLFSHTIETSGLDGSFSTSNICYRRQAVLNVGGFDPDCDYWEDTDLGWRVCRSGWKAVFAPRALVHHQIIQLNPLEWLRWPLHFRTMPAKAKRYPEFRSHLFMGLWVHWFHAAFDLALVSIPLAVLAHPLWLVLALPYAVGFPRRHGLRGRLPPVKAALHMAWDGLSFVTLLFSSLRRRSLVL